jgi:hypothetical protein
MGMLHHYNIGINVTPQLPAGTKLLVNFDNTQLCLKGLNIPVEISTAAIFRGPPNNASISSFLTMAHFDTGANITSIDMTLAKHLNLIPTGQSTKRTAAGISQPTPNFVIDLNFRVSLSPFFNLRIGSCDLGFNLPQCLSNPNVPVNFGILIGRDIMSRWNIVWNGPTSTVFISD